MSSDLDDDLYADLGDGDANPVPRKRAVREGGIQERPPLSGGAMAASALSAPSYSVASESKKRARADADDEKPESDRLKERIRMLEEENRILKRNMGTLYRTAVAEIRRKDEQINRLVE